MVPQHGPEAIRLRPMRKPDDGAHDRALGLDGDDLAEQGVQATAVLGQKRAASRSHQRQVNGARGKRMLDQIIVDLHGAAGEERQGEAAVTLDRNRRRGQREGPPLHLEQATHCYGSTVAAIGMPNVSIPSGYMTSKGSVGWASQTFAHKGRLYIRSSAVCGRIASSRSGIRRGSPASSRSCRTRRT